MDRLKLGEPFEERMREGGSEAYVAKALICFWV